MHKSVTLVTVALLLLLGSACARESQRPSEAGVEIGLTAVPFPPVVGKSRLVIHVTDEAGNPIDNARLSVKGDMTHAGMVPVLAATAGGGDGGYYEVPFEWSMAGDWVVTVEATLANGSVARQRFDLAILTEDEAACEDGEQEQ